MSDRQGIEIDYCPECRGVWLDRGELDKIIERSDRGDGRDDRGRSDRDDRARSERDDRRDDRDERNDRESYGKKPKKREGFLSELFEFGG
jgi:Zn-finger nucleic acid-binding protein